MFLEWCCASDSELAAVVVEHSVAIRVASSEDLQLTNTRCALHRLLRICFAYDVVVDIWVWIPCTVGTRFGWINDTYKLVGAAIGLCRHVVRIGGGFSWEWTGDCKEISSQSVTPRLVWSRPLLLDNNLSTVRGVCSTLRRSCKL